MAFEYQSFASLGVNLNRQKYGPLDISNVFTSEADLKYYLTKGTFTEGVSKYWYESATKKVVPYPYEGQVLATVINGIVSVYVLALDTEGNFITQEIAGKIEVDNKTVKLNADGQIELVGLDKVVTGKTYVPSLVNGVLTWSEPDTETAEGQAAELAALGTRTTALESVINGIPASGETAAVKGLVEKVADEVAARAAADEVLETKIAEALSEAKQYADDNDANTIYDDTALIQRIVEAEAGITSHESRLAGIELFFNNAAKDEGEGESLKNALDTLVEIQEYIENDGAVASTMLESIETNKNAIAILTGNDTVDGSVNKIVKEAVSAQANIDAASIAEVRTIAAAAAVASEVEAALEDKVSTAALSNYHTKEESYSIEQIDALLAGIKGEYGETADTVAGELSAHKQESSAKFAEIEAAQGDQDNLIKNNSDAIAAITNESTGILAQALTAAEADAQSKVTALANGQVATNTSDIATINSQIEGINNNVTTISNSIGTLSAKDTEIVNSVAAEKNAREALTEVVDGHTSTLTTLNTKVSEIDAAVIANTAKFDSYATTAQVDEKIAAAVNGIDNTAITKAIADNALAISTETTRADTEEKRLAELINKNATDIGTNAADIRALETAINAVIENDDDTALNSIKELAVWVTEHNHDVDVLSVINENKAAIETLTGTGEGSIQQTVTNAIANSPVATYTTAGRVKGSDEVTVEADGTMGIGYISTDKLVQGTETLVLNGGTSKVD